jgi:hypothetical protein
VTGVINRLIIYGPRVAKVIVHKRPIHSGFLIGVCFDLFHLRVIFSRVNLGSRIKNWISLFGKSSGGLAMRGNQSGLRLPGGVRGHSVLHLGLRALLE